MSEAIEPMRYGYFQPVTRSPFGAIHKITNPGIQHRYSIIIIMKLIHPALPFLRVRYDYDITLDKFW